jgi:hypothetical protein
MQINLLEVDKAISLKIWSQVHKEIHHSVLDEVLSNVRTMSSQAMQFTGVVFKLQEADK